MKKVIAGMTDNGKKDLTPSQIVGLIRMQGLSLRELSRRSNLGQDSLRNALYRHCPKYERIIAENLGVEPKDIWASRY